jgi:tRNA-splicing ligase RtcB
MTGASVSLPDRELASLEEGTVQFDRHVAELRWAQRFALLNREEMMDRVTHQLGRWVGEAVLERERINCHDNFTQQEEHFGETVWLSREGAISARAGQPGLIPGSMGTASYVVEGLGNELALPSSPHRRVPRRLQADRPGDGGCRGPRDHTAHAAPARERHGRLTSRRCRVP